MTEAQRLIERGALWNYGIFSFRLGYLIEMLEKRNLPTDFGNLRAVYGDLPATSFDYEVVEREQQVVVVPYEGRWSDLGTWSSLTDAMESAQIGNGLISKDCRDTHLINELDLPVAVIGVSGLIVAASPDGILVADKCASHRIKEYTDQLGRRPMFEERRWGSYRVLDYQTLDDGSEFLTKRLRIRAGKNLSYQYHMQRSEIWTVIAGRGELVLDGRFIPMKPGDVAHIPVGAKHAIRAVTELEIVEVQLGTRLIEEDIVRLFFSWEELLRSLSE